MDADMLVLWTVIALRFFVPLLIPRYPLPAIVAALVLDGIDQTVFQMFTTLPLEGYQSYDKALDVYYLTIAYISTLRNWSNLLAYQVSKFLFYYRLVGVALFELTHAREILLIFPNTFEYFFIFMEAVALRWDPRRLSRRAVIGAAAFIWVVIKLPQEWWIHVAQMDATDFIKETLFGVPTDTPWSQILAANPVPFVVAAVVIVALLAAAWWFVTRRLPGPDWRLSFVSTDHLDASDPIHQTTSVGRDRPVFDAVLLEKIVLVALVGTILTAILPDVRSSNLQLAVGAAFIVTLSAALSHWLARRGVGWSSAIREFAVMAVANFGFVILADILMPRLNGSIHLGNTLFFVLLLTLLVTLYDRYRPAHEARFAR